LLKKDEIQGRVSEFENWLISRLLKKPSTAFITQITIRLHRLKILRNQRV